VQSRRDQAQAYRFVLHRVQAALLQGEPDAPEPPLRRIGVATFVSVMVAVLVVAGFGIVGLIRPGGKQGWRKPGVLVVEKETGTRFVYDPADGALHPVLNYTSARLILNTPDVSVRLFSRRSLADAPRGAARGLPSLPDALPAAGGLVRGPWTVCSQRSGGGPAAVTVSIGYPASGSRVDPGRGLLVRDSANRQYLIWNDTKLEIRHPETVLAPLSFAAATPVVVADTWANAVPSGPDLAPPEVPGRGGPAPYRAAGAAVQVGQVLKVAAEGGVRDQYWLALTAGLTPVTDTAALLLLGVPDRPDPIEVQSADVNAIPHVANQISPAGFPDRVPALVEMPDGAALALCAAYTDTSGSSAAVAISTAAQPPGQRPAAGGAAGSVLLPPGAAAVVRLLPHPGQDSDSIYLVTETGAKYPVPSAEVLAVLGYGGSTPVPVPGGLLDLVPTGPALDPARANSTVPVGPAPTSQSGQSQQDGGA